MKEHSQIDDMRAAIRGDLERNRARQRSAAVLAPEPELEQAPVLAPAPDPEIQETPLLVSEPEPEPEPEVEETVEPEPPPGFFRSLFSRA
jgi:hypothetical protein